MLDDIIEAYPNETFLKADGFDDCITGLYLNDAGLLLLTYSRKKILEKLSKDMSNKEALEYFEYNIEGAHMGDKTPMFIDDCF